MAVSELCKDQIRIRLISDEQGLFLQINSADEPAESREGMMPCDPDVLCAVLRGLTYQLSSKEAYCVIRRSDGRVNIEFQQKEHKHRCVLAIEEFSHLVAPVMPARLRAMLL